MPEQSPEILYELMLHAYLNTENHGGGLCSWAADEIRKLRKRITKLEANQAKLGVKWSEYVETLINLTDALAGSTPKRLRKGKQFNNVYVKALMLLKNDINVHGEAF